MRRLRLGMIACTWLAAGTMSSCSNSHGGDEPIAKTEGALLGADQFLYFTCNATGWNPAEANRLKATSDPAIFTLDYQVAQPWQVSSPDQCQFILTNQLDGYGTSQTRYVDSHPTTPVVVPGSDQLVTSTQNFAVKYPATGTYTVSVNWSNGIFSIAPRSGIIGDCGPAPKGSNPAVQVDYVLVYDSPSTRWCVDRDMWSQPGVAQAVSQFYSYGEAVYAKLQSLFTLRPGQPFVYQVLDVTGGAHTGSDFGLGVSVTGDAFANIFYDQVTGAAIPGFWGYLLTLHEAINDFTGLVSPGWPSDWWADHRSPFPNALDYFLLRDLGAETNNSTVSAAAIAQHRRFGDPSREGYDPEVGMFESLYTQYGGYSAFTNTFGLLIEDGILWNTVDSGHNPSEILTEYVIAYLQMGIRTTTDLTDSLFKASGVGSLDTGIGPYPVSATAVRAIATAHCSIVAARGAGVDVSAQLDALRAGDYQNAVATGGTQAMCPAECAWSATTSLCGARF